VMFWDLTGDDAQGELISTLDGCLHASDDEDDD